MLYDFVITHYLMFASFRKTFLVSLPLVICCIPILSQKSIANSPIIHFNLRGQPLATGLVEFAIQSHTTIIVPKGMLKGLQGSPLIGPWALKAGIQQLLDKSHLSFQINPNTRTITISNKHKSADPRTPSTLPTDSSQHIIEETFVKGRSHANPFSRFGAHQINEMRLSRSITTLSKTLIENAQVANIGELLEINSSVTAGDGLASSNDDYFMRGFQRNAIFIDGFRLDSQTGTFRDPLTIEQADIIKGPASLFFGQAEAGGVINLVSAKPQARPHLSIHLRSGQGNEKSIATDAGNQFFSQTLSLRGIAKIETRDSYGIVKNLQQRIFYPAFNWKIGSSLEISGSLEKQYKRHTRQQNTLLYIKKEQTVDLITLKSENQTKQPHFESRFLLANIGFQYHWNKAWHFSSQFFTHKESLDGIRGQTNTLINSSRLELEEKETDSSNPSGNPSGDPATIPILTILQPDPESQNAIFSSTPEVLGLHHEAGKIQTHYFKSRLAGTSDILSLHHHFTMGLDLYSLNKVEHH